MVQGVIFSMPCTISLLGADGTLYWALRRRRYGFPATANIRCIKKCAGILRTANKSKLSTKQPVKIRALIVQPENYWGPTPDCRGPPVFTRWTYRISKVMCRPEWDWMIMILRNIRLSTKQPVRIRTFSSPAFNCGHHVISGYCRRWPLGQQIHAGHIKSVK